jgi:hypothetical protein
MKLKLADSPIYIIAIFAMIFSLKDNYEGGDINLARLSYLGANSIDLWGGFSGLFYGNIPNTFLLWGSWLLLFQVGTTTAGLLLISRYLQLEKKSQKITFIILSYFVISFSVLLTRDSTMASMYIFGFGSILASYKMENFKSKFLFIIGTAAIILSIAFRPWLFFATLLPFLIIRRTKKRIIPVLIVLALLPIGVEKLTYTITEYKEVHPELQVIIADLSSMTCLSNDNKIREKGNALLNQISGTKFEVKDICADFRLSNWGSIGSWALSKSELNDINLKIDQQKYSKITISSNLSNTSYLKIRDDWARFILGNPKAYLEAKSIQANQVLLSGDTFGLRIFSANNFKDQLTGFFFLFYDLSISLHLLSPIFTLIIGTLVLVIVFSKLPIYLLLQNRNIIAAYSFVAAWIILTTFAYIGDNGRYTYLSSFIFYFLIFKSYVEIYGKQGLLKGLST